MRTYVLYTKSSPSEGEAERFVRELKPYQVEPTLVDADSREGASLTEQYDLLARPAVVVVGEDGGVVGAWSGELPAVSEISYLVHP